MTTSKTGVMSTPLDRRGRYERKYATVNVPGRGARGRGRRGRPEVPDVPPWTGRWSTTARDDPTTGLIAWAHFNTELPLRMADALAAGQSIGIAIGDVDDLNLFVEFADAAESRVAGGSVEEAIMAPLGAIARHWLAASGPRHGALATFGSDEIIFVADAPDETGFLIDVHELRDVLCNSLPRTVSFAVLVITPDVTPARAEAEGWDGLMATVIDVLSRTVEENKQRRRLDPTSVPAGFVEQARLEVR